MIRKRQSDNDNNSEKAACVPSQNMLRTKNTHIGLGGATTQNLSVRPVSHCESHDYTGNRDVRTQEGRVAVNAADVELAHA